MASGYSKESLQKLNTHFNEYIRKYEGIDTSNINLCISKGNRKIGRVMNVSLPPVKTCPNCSGCMHYCYDIKACLQYPNTVVDARIRNYSILMKDRDDFFARIDSAMSRRRTDKYFRWHVAGEIVDLDYFVRMVENAKKHPDFVIWTYTKNYKIVNQYCDTYGREAIPSNFHIMFSEWDGMPLNNPHGFPEFSCKLPEGNKNHPVSYFNDLWKCPGNCDICKKCNRGCIAGETSYADLH